MLQTITFENIQDITNHFGFSLCGVTDAAPLADFDRYQRWISAGNHGAMKYLENSPGLEIRANPQLFFPQSRSILVCGIRYAAPPGGPERNSLYGLISSYAWGDDYHTILQRRTEQIAVELSRLSGKSLQARTAIDSAPVLEKPLARRAGLGWQGKNSCLIHPQMGSFFFLINIFTSLEIPLTQTVFPDRCGTCRRCMDACPTGCILPGRTIDARKCISYLTIENKGSIPRELRPQLGRWLFGCDVCQSVCPWNRKVNNADVIKEFLPRAESAAFPDLLQIVRLTEPEFKMRFKDSPILRAKRRGLLRNAAVVLGNYHSPEALPPLAYLLQNDPEPLIRSHAAWGLGCVPASKAQAVLANCLKTEPDEGVRLEIMQALAEN